MSQAKASALCEALERFSGTFQGDEARVRSSRAALGVEAITPNSLLQFSQSQIRARDGKLRAQTLSLRVPAPLHDDTEIDWTPGWSLTMSARRFLPFTYCYSNAPAECGVEFCRPCGNGVAAGTCMEEAILQGVLELVERDAASIWWYNMVVRPAVDLASFSDPFFQTTLAEYASIGWELWALDLTHDLQIAAVVAVAYQRATDAFCVGFGCHLNATLAVQRALTEVNQLLQLRRRQGISVPTSAEERIYLFPCVTTAARRMADLPSSSHQGFRRDLAHSIERLNEARLELIVVDKTRPDIGLNVAHVAVPGLRHIWPRFGPGRLYSVPPALGWLPRALTENQLNQVPLLL